ncbi:MAG: hypothetical protein R3B84_14775 [Zavarzinella sp.]
MGIDAFIETEEGMAKSALFDTDGLTSLLVASKSTDSTSYCLRFIDPWGDTTFNQLQLPFLIEELEDLNQNQIENRCLQIW